MKAQGSELLLAGEEWVLGFLAVGQKEQKHLGTTVFVCFCSTFPSNIGF